MTQARIYKPARTAMQSGQARTSKWRLDIVTDRSSFNDPLMGWTGSTNMLKNEFVLYFDALEDALRYAKNNSLEYEVVEPKTSTAKTRPYADNFKL